MSSHNNLRPTPFADDNARSQALLGRVSQAANRWTRRIADFQARLILTILYVLFVAPVGLALRLSDDLLGLHPRPHQNSYWQARATETDRQRSLRGQG